LISHNKYLKIWQSNHKIVCAKPFPSKDVKPEEQIALEYLHKISRDVLYEPDGKIPPDFKLDHIIAVEVRRLNKNIFVGQFRKGLEQNQHSLRDGLSETIREFDSPIPVDNYRIALRIARPTPKIKKLKSIARKKLRSFLENKPEMPFEIKLSDNVSLILSKKSRKSSKVFHISVFSDKESCGWTAPDYVENINFCISEKTKRIQKYKFKYPEWWLVLVDFLAGGIREPERIFVIQHISKGSDWKKIIIIHPETKQEILKIGSSDFIAE
jgi:hypothetical protein